MAIRIGGWRCQTCGYSGSAIARFGLPAAAVIGFFFMFGIVATNIGSRRTSATAPVPTSVSPVADGKGMIQEVQDDYAFDVPGLLRKSIDEIRNNLGRGADRDLEPTSLQLNMGVDEWSNSFEKDGKELLVTFNPKTRRVVDFFISGTNRQEVLRFGRLSTSSEEYDIEYVKAIRDPSQITGVKVLPRNIPVIPKVVLAEDETPPQVSEEIKPENGPEQPKAEQRTKETDSDFRAWVDSTGEYRINAKFGGMAFGNVTLIKEDGSKLTLPKEKLSEEDQEWLQKRATR
jgi:hypothetical protein